MKKTLKLFMSVLMTFMLIFVYSFGNLVYANGTKIEESEYASYQEKETLKENINANFYFNLHLQYKKRQ